MTDYEVHVCLHDPTGAHPCHCEVAHDHTWDEFVNYMDSKEAYYR